MLTRKRLVDKQIETACKKYGKDGQIEKDQFLVAAMNGAFDGCLGNKDVPFNFIK